jgi:hypothetical protein
MKVIMKNRIPTIALIFGVVLLSLFSTRGQDPKYTEHEVKAAYIVNFTKFVTWPKESFVSENSPFIIGIYGKDNIGRILQKMLAGKRVFGRIPIIKIFNSPEEISSCNILFISGVNRQEMLEALKKVKGKNVLTIGDNISEFCESGGMINFTHQLAKHRFEVNTNSCDRENIRISPKLIALAKIVTEDEIKF